MHAGGLDAQQHIPGLEAGAVDDLFLVHHAHGKAGQVVILFRHHTGMLGRFTADERTAGLDAALRHARHNLGDLLGEVLAAGDVIQEEQGAWRRSIPRR